MYRNRFKMRANSRNTIMITAIVLSIVALFSGVLGIFTPRSAKEGDTIGILSWELGTVSDVGKLKDSDESIRMKDMYAVKDMEITLDDKADITYDIVFYDEDKDYLSTLGGKNVDFDYEDAASVSGAKYFRVVIYPEVEDEDDEIKLNIFNMYKYVKQIKVAV